MTPLRYLPLLFIPFVGLDSVALGQDRSRQSTRQGTTQERTIGDSASTYAGNRTKPRGTPISPGTRKLTPPQNVAPQVGAQDPALSQPPSPPVVNGDSLWIYTLPRYVASIDVKHQTTPTIGDTWFIVVLSVEPDKLDSEDRIRYRLRWGASPEARASGASVLSILTSALVHGKQVVVSLEPGTVTLRQGGATLTPQELLTFEIGSVQIFDTEIECVTFYGTSVIPLTKEVTGTKCIGGKLSN